MTNDKKTEHRQDPPIEEAVKAPGSGRGADSALDVLIKRRLPVPELPLPAPEREPESK